MALEDADKSLFFAVLALLAVLLFQYPTQTIFDWVLLLDILAVSLFVILVLIYCTDLKKNGAVFGKVFWLYMVLAISFVIVHLIRYGDATIATFVVALKPVALYFMLYMILSLFMALAIFLAREQKMYKAAALLFLFVIIMLYLYALSGSVINYITPDDEEILAAHSVAVLLNGTDPYNSSLSQFLYSTDLNSSTGYTITTNNTILGRIDYPAFFFLTFVPFYLLAPFSIYNLEYVYLPSQLFVFLIILLFTVWYVIDKQDVMKPMPLLYLGLAVLSSGVASITTYLMLAFILLAYTKLKSKYAWIFLGISASLQQELWIPVLLLIAYSFNTYGLRKGARDLFGAAAVFLLFNGYFILVNAPAYFNSIFLTLDGLLIPTSVATFGYFLFMQYHLNLTAFPIIFKGMIVLILMTLLYSNSKKAIPVLCMMPFLFGGHSITAYYYFFASFFVLIIFCRDEKHEPGIFRKMIQRVQIVRYLSIFALLCVISFLIGEVVLAHYSYANDFNLGVQDQHAVQTGNLTSYSAIIHYSLTNSSPHALYLLFRFYNNDTRGDLNIIGLGNVSIINNSLKCGYPCGINPNLIELNQYNHTYEINAFAKSVALPAYASVFLYNGSYAYQSQMIEIGYKN